jgi:hypothetical protein
MQCSIRNWIARKRLAAKWQAVAVWERLARKYPHAYHMRIANITKATVTQLVRTSMEEQAQVQLLSNQLRKLIVGLTKGPAGSTDDLRMAMSPDRMDAAHLAPGDAREGKSDVAHKRKRA